MFCKQCGHVGLGRRCTRCGGLMALRHDRVVVEKQPEAVVSMANISSNVSSNVSSSVSSNISPSVSSNISVTPGFSISQVGPSRGGIPVMTLTNDSLNIRIVAMNGAIIGRRKGPYVQFFEQHSYVSGIHAQLKYKSGTGWCVIDKNSSNGTRVNQQPIQPDVETMLKNGDVLMIANISLQVIIK
ncbi:FHA domain-containing protein [Prevotella sp. P6B1]|uniref:FHA domain-containing protein n=2 Tax=unclassified Prevotella TaxID=2638335 RepID=UPI0018CC73B0|nr:FHA domain-containing protein [Prevotella sp. P6B1]